MKDSGTSGLLRAAESLTELVDVGTRIGMDLLDTLLRGQRSLMGGLMAPSALGAMMPGRMWGGGCSCAIPPACWVPRPIGEVTSHVCAGGTATLRIEITNCGAAARTYKAEVGGAPSGVTVSPAALALGPMERGAIVVSAAVPADAGCDYRHQYLVWVRGCYDHYARWTVRVTSRGADCCHELDVEDCPDLIHHWYDHFYCQHPCLHGRP